MSTIKVDTIATRTGSGNITVSNNIAGAGTISGTNLTASGTLAVTGNTTVGGTLVNTGLITASAGVAIGGTGAANTLDDYEEGGWTPTIGGSGATYANAQGIYTKIGRYVCASFDITVSARNSGSTNELHGFPFTASLGGQGVNSGHISFYSGVSQNVYSLDMYIINNQTYAYFTGHTTATGNIGNSLAVWQNSTRILGTVHYLAN